jgi:hypothetical protein
MSALPQVLRSRVHRPAFRSFVYTPDLGLLQSMNPMTGEVFYYWFRIPFYSDLYYSIFSSSFRGLSFPIHRVL